MKPICRHRTAWVSEFRAAISAAFGWQVALQHRGSARSTRASCSEGYVNQLFKAGSSWKKTSPIWPHSCLFKPKLMFLKSTLQKTAHNLCPSMCLVLQFKAIFQFRPLALNKSLEFKSNQQIFVKLPYGCTCYCFSIEWLQTPA